MGKEQRSHGMNVQPGQGLGLINAPRKGTRQPLPKKAIACMVAACFAADVAVANPANPSIINGVVSFDYNGSTLTITNTPGSIINWQGFSIGVDELTRFIQQSASSAVLNRVTGVDPSVILGALQSNGHVFLINPNGVLFGAGSQIDVAGLVASSLNLSDADFLAGNLNFTATAGAGNVANAGNISAGSVYLIAPNVENSGIITSANGEVVLAAGHSVQLVGAGTPNLRVEVAATDNQALNLGQIVADSGSIGIYAGLVSNSGTLNASSAVAEGGKIVLKATQTTNAGGTITATGTQGGTVHVLGDTVNVDGNIDVSGTNGGGTILVGGDYQGSNPDIQNASFTNVSGTLTADAIQNGNGGKVIVWSDDTTHFDGHVSARGGADGGNGGFAEVSGKHNLYWNGTADLRAPHGAFGTLLLDPGTVRICAFDGGESCNGDGANTFEDDDISFLLGMANLTISTSAADGAEGADPHIIFDNDVSISWNAPTVFTLNAGNFIAFDGSLNAVNSGAGVTFNAGGLINVAGGSSLIAHAITFNGLGINIYGEVRADSLGPNNFVNFNTSTGSIYIDGGVVKAYGGTSGGNATITMTAGTSVYLSSGAHIGAYGYDGSGAGNGGAATVTLTSSTAPTTLISNSYVEVVGGDGGESGGSGGFATLTLNGSGIEFFTNTHAEVHGGDGANSGATNGGNGNFTANAGTGSIHFEQAYVNVDGGEGNNGGTGGTANLQLNASGGLLSNDSSLAARGGYGYEANGGAAFLNVVTGSINITDAYGGEGSLLAQGGNAGSGGAGAGGTAELLINTAGSVMLTEAGIYAKGGDGDGGNGGDATLGIVAGGNISVIADGGEMASINADGGGANSGIGGNASTGLFSSNGNILIDGDDVTAEAGSGDTGDGTGETIVRADHGSIDIQNDGLVGSSGVVNLFASGDINITDASVEAQAINVVANNLNVTANNRHADLIAFSGNLNVIALGNITLHGGSEDFAPAFMGGYGGVNLILGSSDSEVRIDAGSGEDSLARIGTGPEGSIFVTYLERTSGGYSVNGQDGAINNNGSGFFSSPDLDEFVPAVLDDNLFIHHLGGVEEEGLSDEILAALNFITGETNNTEPDNTASGEEGSDNTSDDKKPSCS